MVAFAIERHFDRQVITECLPILRTFGSRNSLVSLRKKTCAREGFPIKPFHNKPRCGLSPHSRNNVAFTRFHVHGQRLIFIHRNGFSHLHNCLNSRYQIWISCTSVCFGLHQLTPHMNCPRAWLYKNLHEGMMCISSVRAH